MKRVGESSVRNILLAATVCLAFVAVGCGTNRNSDGADERPAPANPNAKPVDPTTAGVVTGVIKFDGQPPQMREINMASVPNCAKLHDTPQTMQDVVVGDDGGLQNVVVYLKGNFTQYSFPLAMTPVQVDQGGCVFTPHVVALMTGQQLEVTNTDTVTHNVNVMSTRRQGWNQTLATGAPPIKRTFTREEVPIAVKCNIHQWMKFYIAVLGHPYFQVTGRDGSFLLRNVPPGTYILTAWHEKYGTKEQTITVMPNSEQNVSITFTEGDH